MINHELFADKITAYLEKMDQKQQPLSLEVVGASLSFSFYKHKTQHSFHIFGITKLLMSYMVQQLADQNIIDLDKPITTYLDETVLENLFVFRQNDYQNQVTIKMLLEHTSGLADYFEGINQKDEYFVNQLINQPHIVYKPMDLINFTKSQQSALGVPGQRFYYSDTGYVLLGIILEKVTQKSLDELIKDYITKPLNLKHTTLYHENIDAKDIEDVIYNGFNIKALKSLTAHWGGSGVLSTHHDLITLMKSVTGHDQTYPYPFIKGIYYGQGIMKLRLDQLSFLSRTPIKTPLYGHMSFYGTHLWADHQKGLYISLNQGSNKYYEKAFKMIAYIIKTYHQMIEEA